MKICSFKDIPGVQAPEFTKESPENVTQLGTINGKFYFSYDDANASVQAPDAASELKVYDFTDDEDVAEIKASLNGMFYVTVKIEEMERTFFAKHSQFSVLKGIKDSDSAVLAAIDAHEDERDSFLQSLGFPGTSILN
jgi:hypothetical protein